MTWCGRTTELEHQAGGGSNARLRPAVPLPERHWPGAPPCGAAPIPSRQSCKSAWTLNFRGAYVKMAHAQSPLVYCCRTSTVMRVRATAAGEGEAVREEVSGGSGVLLPGVWAMPV